MAIYDGKVYGAVRDGITKDTAAIQRAIDRCFFWSMFEKQHALLPENGYWQFL